MTRQERADIVLRELKKLYPNPKIALNYSNVIELLVATILSAQSTDKKINEITAKLFKKYPNLEAYLNADLEEFQEDIRQSGFFRNKAKNILNSMRMIKDDYGGKVPDTMEELLKLSGVARKTANVILGVGYNKPAGIVVDTHVIRLANKFGLTKEKNPVKIEQDLMRLYPQEEWRDFSLALVLYGREHSTARQKDSDEDPISQALVA